MKLYKLFLISSFVLLFVTKVLGQPYVDIQLSATNGTYIIPLAVGIDPTATNGIDPQFGESDLPPFPPYGVFEIRFDLQPYTGEALSSYKDYRNGISYIEIEHMLWWQVSNPGLPIEIQYDLPNYSYMTIKDLLGGILLDLGWLYGQGTAIIPEWYTAGFTRCLLIMGYNWTPVEFTSFTASILQNEKVVQLNWSTATETNNSGFEIERASLSATPGQGWEKIGFVPGFGTITEPKSYSFVDENLAVGIYKYRLKQIDFDGTFEYSNEIEINVDFTPKEFVLYQNYPNPFNPNTTIKFTVPSVIASGAKQSLPVTLKVYDVLGNEVATLVNEEKQPGVYEVEFDSHSEEGQNLSSGIYFYRLNAGSFIQTKKMILAK